MVLYDNRIYASIPILFRSIFEAFVDFDNLFKDPDYINYLDIEYYVEWEKLLKSADIGNPFLRILTEPFPQTEKTQIMNPEFVLLKQKGYKKLRNEDKIKKTMESAVYYSVYNFACNESHNNLRTLLNWYTKIEQDKSFSVECFSQDKQRLIPYLDSACAMLINSTKSLVVYLKIEFNNSFEKLENDLESIRKCV